ncbi:SDR family NAD(P)-dependent oxidoreductase [Rhodococcus ruber]|uniref:SDR family NAD(P)-dependent oxidoreductase n=1 Tax=Rhodococcus ruber TaxID=1830 RepID=UPI00315CACCB
MQMRFDDKVVVVTGAGRGLGREHALQFAARGAKVVVNDLGVESDGDGTDVSIAQTVVDEIANAGGTAVADTHSVADATGAAGVIDTALNSFGRIDVLVNNAGIITYGLFGDLNEDQWRRMQSVTVDGTFFMCRASWPVFRAQGSGAIVNITSNAGYVGCPQLSHYGTAKLAVAGLTKSLALEGEELGIRVNAIAPMAITRMNREAFFSTAERESEDWQAEIRNGQSPMGPAEIVSPTVLWLAHQSTTENGEIFSTSSGKVARIAFIVGEGWFDPNHTPEDLQEHAQKIRELGDYSEPKSVNDELSVIPALFG